MMSESSKSSLLPQSSLPESQSLTSRYTRIVLVVSLYWFVSISLVFVNKSLLSGDWHDAPFFVTWFQCLVTAVVVQLLFLLRSNNKNATDNGLMATLLPYNNTNLSLAKCIEVLPLSVVFVSMIGCNNLCLKYVGVSFYYVGRSLTTVFNVLMSYLILGERNSLRTICCCLVIISGFALGVDQEDSLGTLSISGVVFGVLASLFVSLNAIYTKKKLNSVDGNVWLLTLYNNINACLLFLFPMVLNGELHTLSTSPFMFSFDYWLNMVIGGIFGLAIGFVTGLQIKVTSPLTHNISGTAKAAAQTLMATQINNESKGVWWWTSNALVLIGSMAYARVKQVEMAARASQTQNKP